MDDSHFDRLTRAFGALRTRRAAVLLFGGAVVTPALSGAHVAAKRKRHKKPCKAPKKKCGGKCLAVLTDDNNCGACGARCPKGQACKAGACKGTTTPQECQPGECCEDNQTCNGDGRCRGGVCQPKPTCHSNGESFPATDGTACCSENFSTSAEPTGIVITCQEGELGNACQADGDCRSGSCVGYQCAGCPSGQVVCSGRCVSLDSGANCGTCGNVCGRGDFCQAQTCQPRYKVDATWPGGAPVRVFVESDGAMFVADDAANCVRRFAAAGPLLATYGVCGTAGSSNQHLSKPRGVVATSSLVFIADSGNDRIQIFARDGSYLSTIGTGRGTGPYQFNAPNDIAIDPDGSFYVADSGNFRVQKFNSSGTYWRTFGTGNGAGNTQLSQATGVAVDRLGNVYVADKFNSRVQKFNSEGQYQQTFGSIGHDPGQMVFPSGCAVASNGDVFITDYITDRVQQFTKNGQVVRVFAGAEMQTAYGVFLDGQDNLYVAAEDYGVTRFKLVAPKPS